MIRIITISLMIATLQTGARAQQADSRAPRPVLAWAAGLMETRVALDRLLDRKALGPMTEGSIRFLEPLPPGERMEPRPGVLRIAAARLEDDGRTLVLTTDPHPLAVAYTLVLPGWPKVSYDLSGAEASWEPAGEEGQPRRVIWWPSLDTEASRARIAGSLAHERFFSLLKQPGRLELTSLVTPPRGQVVVAIQANAPCEADLGEDPVRAERQKAEFRLELPTVSTGDALPLRITIDTGNLGQQLTVRVSHRAGDDRAERPFAARQVLVPWAPPPLPQPPEGEPVPDLKGGDPGRGREVFFSQEARCSSCHRIGGEGGTLGPDLSDVRRQAPASVFKDIREPSARIHPEYFSFVVALKDGQIITGTVRAHGADAIRVVDTDAKEHILKRSDIEEIRPTSSSIMPEGLVAALGEQRMRDLIAFLLAPRPGSGGR